MRKAFEQLVRPTYVDRIESGELPLPTRLAEGEEYVVMGVRPEPFFPLSVSGALWQTEVATTLTTGDSENFVWGALMLGTDDPDVNALADPLLFELATRSGAVTRLTSYVAGQTDSPVPGIGLSGSFGGASGSSSCCGIATGGVRIDALRRWLAQKLQSIWYDCAGEPHRARIVVETGRGEVVAVERAGSDGASGKAMRCLSRSVWALALPEEYAGLSLDRHEFSVEPMLR
jgi:hypothetical protein